MKILLILLSLFAIISVLVGFEFSTKPLYFKFRDPYLAIGVTLILTGVILVYYSGTKQTP